VHYIVCCLAHGPLPYHRLPLSVSFGLLSSPIMIFPAVVATLGMALAASVAAQTVHDVVVGDSNGDIIYTPSFIVSTLVCVLTRGSCQQVGFLTRRSYC